MGVVLPPRLPLLGEASTSNTSHGGGAEFDSLSLSLSVCAPSESRTQSLRVSNALPSSMSECFGFFFSSACVVGE